MYRYLLGAILPLVLVVWMVAGTRPSDADEGFARGTEILRSRFADWRGRVERAAAQMVALADEAEPRTLFRKAQQILEETGVDGVAILDKEDHARCWAGRTFQLDPKYDLHGVWDGYDAVDVLDHPAHRVLVAAQPAGGEVAVAFYVFDETFPKRRDLAAEVAEEAGLAAVELRYALVPAGGDYGEGRKHRIVVIDGLVHATFLSKSESELDDEQGEAVATRNHMLGGLFCGLLALLIWTQARNRVASTGLFRAVLAVALLVGLRTAVSTGFWSRPFDVLLTGAVALGAAWVVLRTAHHPRARGPAWALAIGSSLALGFLPRAYDLVLRRIVDRNDDVILFDALNVVPGFSAAMLLAGVCLLTLSAFLVCEAARRWGHAAHRHLAWLPFVAIAAGLFPWKGLLLAVGCLLGGLGVRRNVTRFERAASLVFLAALSSLPILYEVHRAAFMDSVAASARDLVRSDSGAGAKRTVREAVRTARAPETGAHIAVAEAIARGRDPKHLAFSLWSASQWSTGDPCAVQIWDMEGRLLSTFDFDSPPARLLPGSPDPGRVGPALLRGRGKGEAIHYYAYDFLLKTLVEERPVAIARFLLPDRWDVLLSDLRPSMFSEPMDRLSRQGARPLLLAELALDGRAQRTSDGTIADFERPAPELVKRALREEYASGPTRYRGHDATLVLTRAGYRIGALVLPDSLLQQGGLALAKVLLVNAGLCLVYGILLMIVRRRPVVFLFRHRVALFLALISIAPVALLAAYDKTVAAQRYETEVAERLKRRLDLAETLLGQVKGEVTNEWCTAFAADHRMDLNVYKGQELIATSRPGVWDTGLLARRLSSHAYLSLDIEDGADITGREYFTRDAGLRAAYRKVRRQRGKPDLILMAPALDDRRAVERRAAESNALLLAIYLTTALLAVFVALYLARSLTSPVHELREATQRVAAGDLDATLQEGRTDEFGDLVRAFNRMTREIAEAQELRVRVEKAAAWREMARQIAHEIKNPLTPIKLTVQNLLANHDRDSFKADFDTGAKLILDQIDALQRIAADFSAYARFPTREPVAVELNKLLRDVAALFAGSGVEADTLAGKLVVEADRDELRRALINLVTNSQQAGAASIRLGSRGAGSDVIVTVTDDGGGIHRADLDRIWEPSFTTKSSGTGLGMPIVKRVIDDLGGTITIDSEQGRGTTVIIRLPKADS